MPRLGLCLHAQAFLTAMILSGKVAGKSTVKNGQIIVLTKSTLKTSRIIAYEQRKDHSRA
ncbi:MAG: hypothetical protein ACJAYE_001785 [Candidatus Azotimanducaceae bacterium]|jgi:hypothetical protein